MHGLLLDASAPLYGRARELLKIEPLPFPYIAEALRLKRGAQAVESFATWGGIPRYWELAREHADLAAAQRELVLDPLGVLHREPDRLLLDEVRQTMQAHSILALIGQGSHRLSEIAGRLGRPATSMTRPLALLVELGFIARERPFGDHPRKSKRTRYRIVDPFLRFWYRFVDPNRSLLQAGHLDTVYDTQIAKAWPHHLGEVWEELARASVPKLALGNTRWGPASCYWGRAADQAGLELDVVAQSLTDPDHLLIGEAKLTCTGSEAAHHLAATEAKARRCTWAQGKRLSVWLWVLRPRGRRPEAVIDADQVLSSWRATEAKHRPTRR